MYCSRFDKGQFLTFLPKNHHHQLKLPKTFARNCLRHGLPETSSNTIVSLKGPSGQTWAVQLTRNGEDDLCFKKGWEAFVNDHNLKEKDGLFFKYKSGVFDVLMFDNEDSCEKASSYFIGNCQGCNGGLSQRRQVESEHKKPRYSREKSITVSSEDTDSEAPPPRSLGKEPVRYQRRFTNTVCGDRKGKAIVEREEVSSTESSEDYSEDESNTLEMELGLRSVDGKENNVAYKQAVREGNRRGKRYFVVLIQPSHVAKNFFMTIPAKPTKKYLPPVSTEVSLKMNGKTWKANFLYYGKGKTSGLSRSGWQNFARENKVKAGNACLFEPTSSSSKSMNEIAFNVTIFRNVM